MSNLGEFLAQCRKNKALSQKEVAALLGYVSGQFISNWERNICMPPIPQLRDLAKIYEVSEQVLFNMILEKELTQVAKELHKKLWDAQQEKIELPKIELKYQTKE
ncbi:helix-turn-helix domain-containing protein [Bdellovibrio sp. HCB209]|uniref:helix-turn-helix domain-containing protein n=1 Tax=Bdellovibrio sp. HCB209 TaxID=3394354 RepID=UPI0039B436E6